MPTNVRTKNRTRKGSKSYVDPSTVDPDFTRPITIVHTPSGNRAARPYVQHKFIRYGAIQTLTGTAVTPQLGVINFAFAGVVGSSTLASLYDQYRIDAVEVIFNVKMFGASTSTVFPKLIIYPDWDDGTPPPGLANVLQHPRCSQHVFSVDDTEYRFALQPRVAMATFNGTFSGYSQPTGATWCDSTNSNIQQYGAKYALTNFDNVNTQLEYVVKYWVTMRNPI